MDQIVKVTEVNKSTCDVYNFSFGSSGWATIFVDKRGLLSIQSDWGNFGHYWSRHGRETFKEFIIEMGNDIGYLATKLTYNTNLKDCLYLDKTLAAMSTDVLRGRRDGMLKKDEAREIYEDISKVKASGADNVYKLVDEVMKYDALGDFYDRDPFAIPICTGIHPRVLNMLDAVLPPLVEQLKRERTEKHLHNEDKENV